MLSMSKKISGDLSISAIGFNYHKHDSKSFLVTNLRRNTQLKLTF